MDENIKIDEAIDYVRYLVKELDPEKAYKFHDLRSALFSVIGYLTLLKVR